MPRSIWKGAITFGLVNIPVEVHSAVSSSDRISFRQLHKTDNSTVKNVRYCAKEDKPISYDEIVKGYEYSKGKFVVMEEEDFRAATIESSKTIEIQDFVKNDDVDPRYFESPYYLVPQKGGEKAYALLREAVGVLMEWAPPHLDVREIERTIQALPGVTAVHDLHVWTIASGMVAFSGHVVAGDDRDPRKLLQEVCDLLHDRFEISHSTIQIESQDFDEPGGVCFT